MLLFQILAALWDRPATAAQVVAAIAAQSGRTLPEHPVQHQLELLHGCGYLDAAAATAAPAYSLTSEGSALLARMAEAIDTKERVSA